MAFRTAIVSLGLLILSARTATATTTSEDITFMAYEVGYGHQSESQTEPAATPDGGYGYQVSTAPESTLPSITTPSPYYTTASSSSSSRTCTNSTTTITIPYSTSTPSTSHTCHNTTITSTIYPSISTPGASPSRNCSKTTTTVTIPWPGTGTGYLPSGTGYANGGGGWNGTNKYHSPTLGINLPSHPTPIAPTNTTSGFELPEETSSEAKQSSSAVEYGGDTPTPTSTPELQPQPEPSGNVPPAPPASSTGPEEPLFTGGAARYGSGVSLAVAVGALVAWL